MSEPLAWINGRVIPQSEAAVPITDLGVTAGATVSEMIRTFNFKPFRLADHLDRLQQSIESVHFETPFDRSRVEAAVTELIEHNSRLIPSHHDLGINIFVTGGQAIGYFGLAGRPHAHEGTVCVNTFPLPFELWADRYRTGLRLASVPTKPIPPDVLSPQIKHRNRLFWQLADREARQRIPGSSAVPVSSDGDVTETSTGNIISISNRTLTLAPREIVLHGVSEQVVAELAGNTGFKQRVAGQSLDELASANEVVVSSTHYCLLPVTYVDDKPIGTGEPGSFFTETLTAWSNQVGVDIVRQATRAAADRTR